MASPASERTPLLQADAERIKKADAPIVATRTGLEPQRWVRIWLNLPVSTLRHYWFGISLAFVSAVICCQADHKATSIDPLIFKSMFIVFGFAIGFRNVRANQRRGFALDFSADFFGAAWGILSIFPDECRAEVARDLALLCDAVAAHISLIATRSDYMYGIVGLQPAKNPAGDPESAEVNLSPRTLMMSTLFACEDKIDQLERWDNAVRSQKMIRTFWAQKQMLIDSYNGLLHMAMPSVSDRYIGLIDLCLCFFAFLLPWGLKQEHIDLRSIEGHLYIKSSFWLVLNTMTVAMVLFALNSLAAEHENPFDGNSFDDIQISKFAVLFRTAVEGYDARLVASECLAGGEGLAAERLACGDPGLTPKSLRAEDVEKGAV